MVRDIFHSIIIIFIILIVYLMVNHYNSINDCPELLIQKGKSQWKKMPSLIFTKIIFNSK